MIQDIEKIVFAFNGDIFGEYLYVAKGLVDASYHQQGVTKVPDMSIRIDPTFLSPFINVISMTHLVYSTIPKGRYENAITVMDMAKTKKLVLHVLTLRHFDFKVIDCYFDCNMLALNKTSMYVWNNPPSMRNIFNKLSWLSRRIDDRKFCLAYNRYSNEDFPNVINVAYILVSNGWVMDDTLLPKESWTLNKWSNTDKKVSDCAICQEEFQDNDIVFNTCCGHSFHWMCPQVEPENNHPQSRLSGLGFHRWIHASTPRSEYGLSLPNSEHIVSCPSCRARIL